MRTPSPTTDAIGLERARWLAALMALALLLVPREALAMHLAEGILPLDWAALWTALAIPFVAVALHLFGQRARRNAVHKPLVAMVAAAVFVMSCMPVPVPTAGTCSHPCGTGFAAIIIGPWMTILVTVVALLLQATFLAHGGFTTLGANVLSMGIVGAFVGHLVFRLLRRLGAPLWGAAFAVGLLADWATYAMTSFEIATAFHGARSLGAMFVAVALAFVPTQLPLAILEGFLSAGAVTFLARRRPELLARLGARPLLTGALP